MLGDFRVFKALEKLWAITSKQAKKQSVAPLMLTSSTFFLATLVNQAATVESVFLFFSVCAFQFLVGSYEKIYYALVKLEVKNKKTNRMADAWGWKACVGAGLLPLIDLWSPIFSWLCFFALVIVFRQAGADLFLSFLKRKEIKEASVNYLANYQPEIAVYVTGMKEVAYQVNQWIPVLEKLNKHVLIITRESNVYDDITNTHIPVVTAKTQLELEAILGAHTSIKKVLYPANTMKNVQALRYSHLQHCFINHGESDKAVNQSKVLMAYDKLLLAGPLSEQRLRDGGIPLRDGQVEYVGRPQAELLLDSVDKVAGIKKVLYAPTWEGYVKNVDYSSIDELGYKICKQLLESDKYEVLFKPHPYTGKVSLRKKQYLEKIKALFKYYNATVYDDGTPIYDLMNQSDVLICDVSSVLNEYLVTKKPILLCKMGTQSDGKFVSEFPSARAATLISEKADVLSVLHQIEERDECYQERKLVRRESLGEFPEGALVHFTQAVENLDR
ncbi:CDP-glycerol glycerophosphotransferase family protein [Halomonas getboli]|uniref:CDP-glycerol glycerophosphotransferase family protein n=1 Tax=Halomonas getboli TaxID=2935862 RepID=UPI001FFEE9B3|nr:CDP-glycerol glycerophosphotransferase family protein [Halomonas getboli]MCK2183033.1 CDP-glycerol glycerophosphotransferase family protein [Halomonas getboli]